MDSCKRGAVPTRQMIFDFLQEALDNKAIRLDVFAYDLDEPDIIRGLAKLGPRLRLFLDNAGLHTKDGAVELEVRDMLAQAAGSANVRVGHFKRFAHQKVFIQKKGGKAIKVLTGSAHFSVRGLYVQADNVLLFNDATVAGLFAAAFEQAFTDPKGFANAYLQDKVPEPFKKEWSGGQGQVVHPYICRSTMNSLSFVSYAGKILRKS